MSETDSLANRGLRPVVGRRLIAVLAVLFVALGMLVALPQAADAATGAPITIGAKCLDDRNYDTTNGAIVQLYSCNGATAQSWSLETDGTIRVQGICLDVKGASAEPGAVVQLWSCVAGVPQQKWALLPNGTITSILSGLCLAVTGGAIVDGARVELAACDPSLASQQWSTASTPAPVISVPASQATSVGVATGLTPTSTGGLGRVTWQVTGLPVGMNFNYSTGVILGTPSTPGTYTVGLTATDSRGNSSSASFSWTVTSASVGASYYLDCSAPAAGNGTQASPWNSVAGPSSFTFAPGDRLLVKRGTTCAGELHPRGNGTASAPILLSSYGTGALPVIAGGGVTESAVLLKNQSYWIIENIEVTNDAAVESRRSGLLIIADNGSTLYGLTIRGVTVHDVMGVSDRPSDANSFYMSQGIGVHVPVNGSKISGLTIADNYVHDVHASGMGVYGADGSNTNPIHKQYVHGVGNHVVRSTNDAIVVCITDSPLIEHNTADGAGTEAIDPGNIAGIWAWADDNPTFQFNEVSNIVAVTSDSMAWDCDGYITGYCTYQYNYDHSNYGGIFLDCVGCGGSGKTTLIYRYNVSVNDCRTNNSSGSLTATYFYNNTIDCGSAVADIKFPQQAYLANNIFIGAPGSRLPSAPNYNSNLYRGFTVPAGDPKPSTADPLFVDGVPSATTMGYQSVGGYVVRAGSPAANSGLSILYPPAADYFGNVISKTTPHRGAYGSTGVGPKTDVDGTAGAVVYQGSWSTNADAGSRGGSYASSTSATATATFTFTGRMFSVIAAQATDTGVMSVKIDGRPAVDVALYAPDPRSGKRVFTSDLLDYGSHTITIGRSSTGDRRGADTRLTLDGFEYQ
jgi:hypothetical protein